MSYKVEYYTLAILEDGSIGNIKQNNGLCTAFTDIDISDIQKSLNSFLEPKKQVAVITRIEDAGGMILL